MTAVTLPKATPLLGHRAARALRQILLDASGGTLIAKGAAAGTDLGGTSSDVLSEE